MIIGKASARLTAVYTRDSNRYMYTENDRKQLFLFPCRLKIAAGCDILKILKEWPDWSVWCCNYMRSLPVPLTCIHMRRESVTYNLNHKKRALRKHRNKIINCVTKNQFKSTSPFDQTTWQPKTPKNKKINTMCRERKNNGLQLIPNRNFGGRAPP
jgi:hypothetical protein